MNLSPSQFFNLTPEEINFKIECYNDKIERDDLQRQYLAYNIGACARCILDEKYPSFDAMFPDHKTSFEEENKNAIEIAKKLGDL